MIRLIFIQVQDWIDGRLRKVCGRITPEKQLAVTLLMLALFGALSIYITVSSIYRIGKEEGERLQIEHIQKLEIKESQYPN